MRFTKFIAGALLATSVIAAPVAEVQDLETRQSVNINALLSSVQNIANTLTGATTGSLNALNSGIRQAGSGVQGTAAVTAALNANLPQIVNAITSTATNVENIIKGATSSLTANDVNNLQKTITQLQNTIQQITGTVGNAVKATQGNSQNLAGNTQQNVQAITNSVQRIVNSLTGFLGGVKNTGNNSSGQIVNSLQGLLGSVSNTINSILGGLGINLSKPSNTNTPTIPTFTIPGFNFGGNNKGGFPFFPFKE